MNKSIQWAINKILKTATPEFYGSITLNIQGGKLINVKTEQSEKPELT